MVGNNASGRESWGICFLDFPGCISAGDTFEEVIANGHEALSLHIHGMRADNDFIPKPSPREHVERVENIEHVQSGDTDALYIVPIVARPLKRPSPAVKVTITMRQDLVKDIDAWAAEHDETRSGMIASAVKQRMASGF